MRSVEASFVGTVNVGSGVSKTFNESLDLINSLLGKKVDPIYVEKPSHYFEHTLADIQRMREWFGFSPLSLENGLSRYFEVLGESH
jgi:nucleoside-diphosphate-sugar epimerase